jgi:uncharacterized protein YcaQ
MLAPMLPTLTLTRQNARRLFLQCQGLTQSTAFGRGKGAVLRAIQQLGYVQIDTISVVDRAHHHVLATRIGNYTPTMLHALQAKDRQVFEYWSHAAAYLPMDDYRYYRPMMEGFGQRRSFDKALTSQIMDRIRLDGPLQSRDFEHANDRKGNGWWDWKPAKQALEHLFLSGELMISERAGFQKVYDLAERVLPAHVATQAPDAAEWARFSLLKNLGAVGIGNLADLTYARSTVRRFVSTDFVPDYAAALQALLHSNTIQQVEVEGVTCYALPHVLATLQQPGAIRLNRRRVQFLSPFDNLVINRKRMLSLFGLDYQLECYVPAPKRQYGYFCLPMLWGDVLLGRLDCKAERKTRTLQVRYLQLEPGQRVSAALIAALALGLRQFADQQQCDDIKLEQLSPATLRAALQPLLENPPG